LRSRFVIPAAILVTVAYVKGRLDAHYLREPKLPVERVATPGDPFLRAEAEAADALFFAEAEAAATVAWEPAEPATAPEAPEHADPLGDAGPGDWSAILSGDPLAPVADEPEPAALAEWVAEVAPLRADRPETSPDAESHESNPAEDPAPRPAVVDIDESGRFSLGGWAAQAGHMTLCGVTFRDRRGGTVDPASIRLLPEAETNVAEGGLIVLADEGFAPDAEGFTILLAAGGPGSFAAAGRYEIVPV
jgi:hypothetical protein